MNILAVLQGLKGRKDELTIGPNQTKARDVKDCRVSVIGEHPPHFDRGQ